MYVARKVVIVHQSLNFAGGGELVCLRLVKFLRRSGYHVTLVTVERTNWRFLEKIFSEFSVPDREFYLLPRLRFANLSFLRDFLLLVFFLAELLFLKLFKRDVLVVNTCGEKVLSVADLVYVNGFPLRYAFSFPTADVKRRCYSRLYDVLLKPLDFIKSHVIVANSRFVGEVIRGFSDGEVLVIPPPVETRCFVDFRNVEKENTVVTTCRFLHNQNLELVPFVAKRVKDAVFYVVGPCVEDNSRKFLNDFKKRVVALNVSNIKILVNRPYSEHLKSLFLAKVFFKTLPYETFGMSVVEAMAAGCVPVVPRCGGPWFDILEQKQGVYGFSYESVEEAANLIRMLLNDEKLRDEVAARARERVRVFDSSVFEGKILDVVDKVFKAKFG
jgi:glycosyltransferase involved in cell wall biosynthesis